MKYIQLLACTTLGFMTLGCQPKTDTADITTDQQLVETAVNLPTYKVATITTYPPFATADENGNVTGFDIDIMRAIGEVENFNIDFIDTPWDAWETDLNNDRVDIWAAGITIKEKRKEMATYSTPYMGYETAILTLDTVEYADISEDTLGNYIVGAEANSTSFEIANVLQPNTEKTISFVSNFNAFEALTQQKVNAVIGNNLVLSNITTSYPDFKYKLTPLSAKVTSKKELGFMVKKDRIELADTINSGLEKIKADGTYDDVKKKWFGEL